MKKVLLDENLPRQLKRHFSTPFDVTTVPDLGWQSKENGELLLSMKDAGLSVLVTADQNLRFQQNLTNLGILVAIVRTYDNRLKTLVPLVGEIQAAINDAADDAEYIEIDLRGR